MCTLGYMSAYPWLLILINTIFSPLFIKHAVPLQRLCPWQFHCWPILSVHIAVNLLFSNFSNNQISFISPSSAAVIPEAQTLFWSPFRTTKKKWNRVPFSVTSLSSCPWLSEINGFLCGVWGGGLRPAFNSLKDVTSDTKISEACWATYQERTTSVRPDS